MNKSLGKILFIFAAIVAIGSGTMFAASLRPDMMTVYRPNKDIGAYQRVDESDLSPVKVLRNEAQLRKHEITRDRLVKLIEDKSVDGYIFFDYAVKEDEQVDWRHLRGNKLGTLSVVTAPDERIVAVSASVLGSVAGIVRPGDVVAVVGSDGAKISDFAKIVSVGVGTAAGSNVVTDSKGTAAEDADESDASGASSLTILLAVPTDEAEALASANQGVVLIYNPFCKTQPDGAITPVKQDGASSACPQSSGGATDPAESDAGDDEPAADDEASADDEEPADDASADEGTEEEAGSDAP